MFISSRQKGFSIVEVVIASAIISASLLAIIGISQQSLVASRRALNTYVASTLLEEGAESVRIVRDSAWTNISSLSPATTYYPLFSSGAWSLTTTASDGVVGIFSRTVTVSAVNRDASDDIVSSGGTADAGTKLVTVTVSWNEGGTVASKTISFYVSDLFS